MDYSYNNNDSFGYSQGGDNVFGGSSQGGGGFVQGGLSQNASPGSRSGDRKGGRPAQTLMPTTIKRLLDCEHVDSKFIIDGKEVKQVTFVGQISTVDVQTMNTTYMVDDGTGMINVPKYSEANEDPSKSAALREHVYVRVFGNLRIFSNTRSVVAFAITPITDFNEITFHNLEVISTHLRNTRGPPGQVGGTAPQAGQQNRAQPATTFSNNSSSADNNGGFTQLQSRVLEIFSRDQSDTGSSLQTVAQQMPSVQLPEIRACVDFLTEEGHLYSTIDDDHFKATHS